MQDTFIFLDPSGEQRGPYTIEDIALLLRQGAITPYTIISDGIDQGEELFRYRKTCHLPQPAPTPTPITPLNIQESEHIHVTLPYTVAVRPTSRTVYILCALFLGSLGIHNFIAGFTARGLIQLIITICLGWLVIPMLFIYIWIFGEIVTQKTDAHGCPMY